MFTQLLAFLLEEKRGSVKISPELGHLTRDRNEQRSAGVACATRLTSPQHCGHAHHPAALTESQASVKGLHC